MHQTEFQNVKNDTDAKLLSENMAKAILEAGNKTIPRKRLSVKQCRGGIGTSQN